MTSTMTTAAPNWEVWRVGRGAMTAAQLHDALLGLAAEVARRGRAMAEGAPAGPVRAVRIERIARAERALRRHWRKTRPAGARPFSPAVDALGDVRSMGAAVGVFIGMPGVGRGVLEGTEAFDRAGRPVIDPEVRAAHDAELARKLRRLQRQERAVSRRAQRRRDWFEGRRRLPW